MKSDVFIIWIKRVLITVVISENDKAPSRLKISSLHS